MSPKSCAIKSREAILEELRAREQVSQKQNASSPKTFYYSELPTVLGNMLAIADEKALYVLEFIEPGDLNETLDLFKRKTKATLLLGMPQPLNSIKNELKLYFKGTLKKFETPITCVGTPFQKQVWKALQKIPFGKTKSYLDIAKDIQKPTAVRAAANANGANSMAIIIPCHRVIQSNGEIGGYAGGIERKQWLLNHESKFI